MAPPSTKEIVMRPAPGKPARSSEFDTWVKGWKASAPPPYHIEEHGYAYIICDGRGMNVASNNGAVLFWKPNRWIAEAVLEYLKGIS